MLKISDIICTGYEEFWSDKSKYRVMKGGKGSGKSSTTALNFITRLMKYPNSNLLVVRAVFNTHKDSTFAQLKWAQHKLGVEDLWQNTVSPLEMIYKPTGQKILFRGFDDVLKLASTTVPTGYLNFVWVEEAFELPSESDFEKLELSVARSNVPPPLYNQFTLTFNPWSAAHWLKKKFFDTESDLVSTYTTTYLNNQHLGEDFIKTLEKLKETNYRKYAVAGLGEWGIAEGLVYENWEVLEFDIGKDGVPIEVRGKSEEVRSNVSAERTIYKSSAKPTPNLLPFTSYLLPQSSLGRDDISWQYKHFFGLDFGYVNDPSAFVAFAVNPISKEIYIYDEFYERKLLNSDIAKLIKQKGFAKERIRADCAEPKSIEDLRRMGISRIQPSTKGKDSVLNGIAQIQEYKIFVHPRCENMIHELGSYRWQTDKSDNGINKPEDIDNHLCDALRYGMYDVRFFRPEDPTVRRRTTPQERFNRDNGIHSEDVSGGWG